MPIQPIRSNNSTHPSTTAEQVGAPPRTPPGAEAPSTPKKGGSAPDSFVRKASAPAASQGADSALEQKAGIRARRAEKSPLAGSRADDVKNALNEDHKELLARRPEQVKEKFEKLKASPFVFFRGTPGLFYRYLDGKDSKMPQVLCNGDAHPENFGVVRNAEGKANFALNDFEHAMKAPFTWDLKRAVTGLELAARGRGFSEQDRAKIVQEFTQGYVEALKDFKGTDKEDHRLLTSENTRGPIQKLLEKAEGSSREKFLGKRVDLDAERFLTTDEIKPQSGRVQEFQKALDAAAKDGKSPYKVKDVAAKLNSGTDSIGLNRYYVLVEGPTKSAKDDLILEVKELPGALTEGKRIVEARKRQSLGGDPLYDSATLEGRSFLVRERQPEKAALDWTTIGADDARQAARSMGALLAQAHARDEDKAESRILDSIDAKQLPKDAVQWSRELADQVEADYRAFTGKS